jgi:hypothetical protein
VTNYKNENYQVLIKDKKNIFRKQKRYFMFGTQIGTLELKAGDDVLWSKTGRVLNEWTRAQVQLSPGQYEVNFKSFSLLLLVSSFKYI